MDENLKDLIRNIFFVIVVIAIFTILIIFLFYNKIEGDSSIENNINNNKDMILLVHKSKCSLCGQIKRELWKNSMFIEEINSSTNKRYHTILKKLGISENDIVEPSLVVIREGRVESILVNIQNIDDLKDFIEYNSQSN